MSIGKKLQQLIKSRKTNINELAGELSVPPTTLYNVVKRDSNKVDIDLLHRIALKFKVPLEYFTSKPVSTTGLYFCISVIEQQLIQEFRKLDEDAQEEVLAYVAMKVEFSERKAKETEIISA